MTEFPEHPPARSGGWSFVDFILIWLGGVFATGVLVFFFPAEGSSDWLILAGLAAQYLGTLGVFWLLWERKSRPDTGFTIEVRDVRYAGLGVLFQLALALLFLPLTRILFPDGGPPQIIGDVISNPDATLVMKVGLFSAAVLLAPATEELVYRGVLLKALGRMKDRLAIFTTAIVFAAVHVVGLDPDRMLASAAVALPPIFLLGLVLAWVTKKSGRLGPAIFLHSGWNFLAAVVLLLPQDLLEGLG